MNAPNNKRKKTSKQNIEAAFIELIQTKEINEINVTDLVKIAHVNRSTFYVNYLDINDLADKIRDRMYHDIIELYQEERIKKEHSYNYLKLFQHIKDNQIYYKTIFKLNFDFSMYFDTKIDDEETLKYLGTTKNIDYHKEFFKAGMNAILKKWLLNGCKESPEEMVEILNLEYKGKKS